MVPVMDIQAQIRASAARWGVDPALALAVAQQESGFRQDARGSSGEIGVFQLMPSTAKDLGVDPSDTVQNIDGGVRYLADQLQASQGDAFGALWRYNAGPGSAAAGKLPESTKSYISAVLGWRNSWSDLLGGDSAADPAAPEAAAAIDWGQLAVGVAAVSAGWLVLALLRGRR